MRFKVIFLGILPLLSLIQLDYTKGQWIKGICESVVDGDTVIVAGKKIRLKGIDAPELNQKSYDGKAIGKLSRKRLSMLILNKEVNVFITGRGRYGRFIGHIFKDGLDINLKMISDGMAVIYKKSSSFKYQNIYFESKLKKKGIFSFSGFEMPWSYRRKKRGVKRLPKSFYKNFLPKNF